MAVFELSTQINAPIWRCFDLARSVELHENSSKTPERAIAGKTSGVLELGDTVTWEARHLGKTRRLTSQIVAMDRPNSFTVEMLEGSFASHRHEISFGTDGEGRTIMHEAFAYQAPFGPIGRLAEILFLTRYMRGLILRRNAVLKAQAESGPISPRPVESLNN